MCARPSDPNLRIDLLRAAEAVFVEHGLDRAKVEDITARAGRSKGAFYLHFDSKEDAFRQIVEGMVARLATFLERFIREARPPADRAELCRLWLEADLELFEFLWQNRGVAQLVFEGGNSARFGYLIDEFAERARGHVRERLGEGVRLGFYRRGLDVEVASLVISGAYDRVGRALVRMKDRPDLRRWLEELQQVVLRGIERDGEVADRRVTNTRPSLRSQPAKAPPRPAAPKTASKAKPKTAAKTMTRSTRRA